MDSQGGNNYSYWGMNNQSQLNSYKGSTGLSGLLREDYDIAKRELSAPRGNLSQIYNQAAGNQKADMGKILNSIIDSKNPVPISGLAGVGRKVDKLFKKETTLPGIDDIFKDPEYFANKFYGPKKSRGRKISTTYLSPKEYLERVGRFWYPDMNPAAAGERIRKDYLSLENNLIYKYSQDMRRGDKFPTPHLDYSSPYQSFGQEGIHRILAAERLGYKEVPVHILGTGPRKPPRTKEEHELYKLYKGKNTSIEDYINADVQKKVQR